jgi:hypothetical protein
MRKEVAKGDRICQLCPSPIKRGESCYTTYAKYGLNSYPRGIHIHAKHCKSLNPKNCEQRMTCVTSEVQNCQSVLCKYKNR